MLGIQFLEQLNSNLPRPGGTDQTTGPNMPSSTGYASATEPATSPPPPSFSPPPNNQRLPSNVEYPGEFDFQINLGQPTSQAAKSVSWTYSPTLKKLFVDRDKPCPIQFKTVTAPPPNTFIRVLPIFKQAENLAEIVARCPNHVGPPEEISKDHLVLCSDPSTVYYTDTSSGRHDLVAPYVIPQVGTEYSKYLFTFKCFISCVGGLNRRKIQLVFTLETEHGNILGRQVLDVRVCACPGRDRKTEEQSFEKSKAPQKKPLKRGPSKVTSVVGVTYFSKKAKKDEETFYIPVQGREKYELLMKIKESLDLMDCVAPSQISQYRQQQAQQQMQLNQQIKKIWRQRCDRERSMTPPSPRDDLSPSSLVPSPTSFSASTTSSTISSSDSSDSSRSRRRKTSRPRRSPKKYDPKFKGVTFSLKTAVEPEKQETDPTIKSHLRLQMMNGVPNLPRVSSFQSAPAASTSQGNGFNPGLVLNNTPPTNHTSSPPALNHSNSFQQQQQLHQQRSLQQQQTLQQQFLSNDGTPCPVKMRLMVQTPWNLDLTPPNPCHAQNISPSQDASIFNWLKKLGMRQHSEIFTQKGVHTVDQLDEINLEDLSSVPHQQREALWKSILDIKSGLQLNHTPTMVRGSSSASTTSIHSSGGSAVGGNQVYRATRFTLKQTLSFKVEKEDDD